MFNIDLIMQPSTAILLRDNGFPQHGWGWHWARLQDSDDDEWRLMESVPNNNTTYIDIVSAPTRDELFEFISLYGDHAHMQQLIKGYAITSMFVYLSQNEKSAKADKN